LCNRKVSYIYNQEKGELLKVNISFMAKTISKDGTSIAYEKKGNGPAVILVDGALCSMAFGPMAKLADQLVQHFTVYRYDRRGRNESTDTKPYSPQKEIEDLDALIKEAGGSASLVGLSSGAALSLQAAAAGLPVEKLVLYEAPYIASPGDKHTSADHVGNLKNLIASENRGGAVKYFMRDMVGAPAFFVALFPLMPVWKKLKAVAHTLPNDASIMGNFLVPEKLAGSVSKPTLIIGGAKSPAQLKLAVSNLAKAIPGAKLLMLEGQNHNVNAKALAPAILNFLN
jgi:pimeloyl-ACP methyl ester carboxylesterase